ncbi:hypothetical protein [Haladaptatus sp. NG-WS-4]
MILILRVARVRGAADTVPTGAPNELFLPRRAFPTSRNRRDELLGTGSAVTSEA